MKGCLLIAGLIFLFFAVLSLDPFTAIAAVALLWLGTRKAK